MKLLQYGSTTIIVDKITAVKFNHLWLDFFVVGSDKPVRIDIDNKYTTGLDEYKKVIAILDPTV